MTAAHRTKKFRATVFRFGELMNAKLSPKDPIVTSLLDPQGPPIICGRDMILLFAPRGTGKSMFALGLGMAIANGHDFLAWHIARPLKVLYIDGEMPGYMVQERGGAMAEALGASGVQLDRLNNNLAYIARDWQQDIMPRLDTPEGAAAVEKLMLSKWTKKDEQRLEHLDGPHGLARWGAEVVIVDNASCLLDPEGEEKRSSWDAAQRWILHLRDIGKTVVLVHHAGRSGEARGHSAKEDLVNTCISLTRPQGYKSRQGCRFIVNFTKGRSLFGDAAEPFEGAFETGKGWTWHSKNKKKPAEVEELEQTRADVRGAIKKYIRAHRGASARRIEQAIHGGSARVRKMLETLLTKGEIRKLKTGGFSCEEV